MGKIIVLHDVSFASNNLGQIALISQEDPEDPNNQGSQGGNQNENQEPNYSEMYFTIESLEDSNTIKIDKSGSPNNVSLSYSINNGETWTDVTVSTSLNFVVINTGDKIIFKGINEKISKAWDSFYRFNASKTYNVYGNVMSLIWGDNFKNNSEFPIDTNHNLCGLFRGSQKIIDASNLVLPATTCTADCYNGMFRSCIGLINAPQLPAIYSAYECYSSMFEGCINLEIAPEINLVDMSENACFRMFCMDRDNKITTPKMTKSPILRVATCVTNCYKEMFKGNGNLNEVICLMTSDIGCTADWLTNVSDTGIFKKSPLKTNWEQGGTTGGKIPISWTIIDYVEE